jgi:hypothetical protein
MNIVTSTEPTQSTRAPLDALTSMPFSAHHRAIVAALVKAYPKSVRTWDLVDVLYGHDPDGGPEDANRSVASMMQHVRGRLAPYGWMIPKAKRGPKTDGYRLAPAGEAA